MIGLLEWDGKKFCSIYVVSAKLTLLFRDTLHGYLGHSGLPQGELSTSVKLKNGHVYKKMSARAPINIVVSKKWVNFQIWVNYHFKKLKWRQLNFLKVSHLPLNVAAYSF